MRWTAKKITARMAAYFRLLELQSVDDSMPLINGIDENFAPHPKDWLNSQQPHKPHPRPFQHSPNFTTPDLNYEPGHIAKDTALIIPSPHISAKEDIPDRQKCLNILVAEDNYANQLVAKTLLLRAGHQVTTVDNGYDAVKTCLSQNFDMILMDIEMPRMTGVEATEIIRTTIGPNQNTIIIALTAFGCASKKFSYLNSGLDDVLCKPFKIAELNSCLTQHPDFARDIRPEMLGTYAPKAADICTASALGETGLIDETTITTLLDNSDEPQIQALIKVFWQSAYALLDDMQYAVHNDDPNGLARAAHALKGSAINLGLRQLSESAANIKETSPDNAILHLESLERCMTRSRKALGSFIGQYAA